MKPQPAPGEATLARVRVDGLDIQVSVRGSGPPLLLIMGLGGNLGMWEPLERASVDPPASAMRPATR